MTNHLDLLADEARRLFDLYIEAEAAYHCAPSGNHQVELDLATSADYAARAVARVRAHAIAYPSCGSAIHQLCEVRDSERNRFVREHLDDVVTKLLASPDHAMPKACTASPVA